METERLRFVSTPSAAYLCVHRSLHTLSHSFTDDTLIPQISYLWVWHLEQRHYQSILRKEPSIRLRSQIIFYGAISEENGIMHLFNVL